MKKFFYNVEATIRPVGGFVLTKPFFGFVDIDTSKPLDHQVFDEVLARASSEQFTVLDDMTINALNSIELDSSNHTDRVLELFRIYVNNDEYYGGMNTNAYVQKELNKLGLSLYG